MFAVCAHNITSPACWKLCINPQHLEDRAAAVLVLRFDRRQRSNFCSMRNLSVLRDSVCAINTDTEDLQQSSSARLCADSDTGNVYVADVTHGSVYCLSSNSQVGCGVDRSSVLLLRDPSAFQNKQSAMEPTQVSFAQLPYMCRCFGRKACSTPQATVLGLTARSQALLSCLSWMLSASPRHPASCY